MAFGLQARGSMPGNKKTSTAKAKHEQRAKGLSAGSGPGGKDKRKQKNSKGSLGSSATTKSHKQVKGRAMK